MSQKMRDIITDCQKILAANLPLDGIADRETISQLLAILDGPRSREVFEDDCEVVQALYASEINCEISTFWDGGFYWKIGDGINGFIAEGNANSEHEVMQMLANAARQHYPNSNFGNGRPGPLAA